jgi:hypothetical protein
MELQSSSFAVPQRACQNASDPEQLHIRNSLIHEE